MMWKQKNREITVVFLTITTRKQNSESSVLRNPLQYTNTIHQAINLYAYYTHTHTHPVNGPFSGTTQVSRYQKGETNLDLLKQETVSGSGISWAIRKSAPCSRQITTPAPHHSVLYRSDALSATQPTASKH